MRASCVSQRHGFFSLSLLLSTRGRAGACVIGKSKVRRSRLTEVAGGVGERREGGGESGKSGEKAGGRFTCKTQVGAVYSKLMQILKKEDSPKFRMQINAKYV